MRWLFIALLLANLLALGAQYAWPRGEATTPVAQLHEGDLRLVAELPRAHTSAPPAGRCYRLAPLRDPRVVRQLETSLGARGLPVRVRERESLEPLGYWVYLPPAASLDAARAVARKLAERGVTDYVFVVGAEKANAISLGLYADPEAARGRRAELQRLGFAAEMERRYSRQVTTELELGPIADEPPELGAAYRWEPGDCLDRAA